MIRYLTHDEIDFKRWDACIDKALNSYVYGYAWYLNIIAGEWDALVEDDYKSVFPLPFREKMGIKYIYQPAFTQQLGLFSQETKATEKLPLFLNSIPSHFRLMELKLNKYHIPTQQKGVEITENTNIELELIGNYDSIYANYSTNLKRNIKKAEKNALQQLPNIKPEELISLFRANKGQEVSAYSAMEYKRFGKLVYTFIHRGIGEILSIGSAENNLLAAALMVKSQGRYIFLFSGLTDEGKQKGAMPFLIDQFIKSRANTEMILDFEGSNDPNLAKFYRSFGGRDFTYYSYRKLQMPFWMKPIFQLYKTLAK